MSLGRMLGVVSVRRAATATSPELDVRWVRAGRGGAPVVVIPGGPGLASVLPYRGFRALAARGGLDVLMVEHRGVGLSRRDARRRELPFGALTTSEAVDDLAAAIDDAGFERVIVYGSSYGTHLAQRFGARYPERVRAMALDSPMLTTDDYLVERDEVRARLWTGTAPRHAELAGLVRRAWRADHDRAALFDVVRTVYELGGEELLAPLLRRRLDGAGRLRWGVLERAGRREWVAARRIPGWYEFDRVGAIAFRELHYGAPADGASFDPATTYAALAHRFPAFVGHGIDVPAALARFAWPTVVVSGVRDVRTPPPIAERVAELLPHSTLLRLDMGHSALESHPAAAVHVLRRLASGSEARLPGEAKRIDALRRAGATARAPRLLAALEAATPGPRPRR